MTIISLPIWALTAAVGAPTICFLWLVLSLIYRKRKAREALSRHSNETQWLGPQTPPDQFHQDLCALQIDAVFNGLAALIETERIKLKALMGITPLTANTAALPKAANHGETARQEPDNQQAARPGIDQQIAQCAADGQSPAVIANNLGLSKAEVDLAMKMRASKATRAKHNLEAVA